MRHRFPALLAALVFIAGCASTSRYVSGDAPDALPTGDIAYTAFLIGNTADADMSVLSALRQDAMRTGDESAIVLLGDLTARGLAEGMEPTDALLRLAEAVDGYPGDVYAIPGDRDWTEGADGVRTLGEVLDEIMDREDVLLPGDALGGVREFELTEGFRLFAIDTAWWLQDPDKRPAGEVDDFDVATPADLTRALQAYIADRYDSQLLIVGHHPVRSVGENSGYRTFGQTLAGFGLVPILRQTIGLSGQDLASPSYRGMREALERSFAGSYATDAKLTNGLVYASSHDHSLQVIPLDRSPVVRQNQLISGASGATRPTVSGRGATYAHAVPGYMRVHFFTDGRTWLEVVEVDGGASTVAYRRELAGVNQELLDPEVPVEPMDLPDTSGSVTMAAQDDFETGAFKNSRMTRISFGKGYRDVWAAPATFPIFDMGVEGGGLTPVKRGGGLQTTSLRLQGADGHQYGLRLLEKSGLAQVPPVLRSGLVGDIVRPASSRQPVRRARRSRAGGRHGRALPAAQARLRAR